jgi:hypothetical protein
MLRISRIESLAGRCEQTPDLLVLILATVGTLVVSSRKGGPMYWYNPTTRASERRPAPATDEQAIEMLAGDPTSAVFVTEYARLRNSGMEIEQALILVGHEFRLRQMERASSNAAFRPRAIGYQLLIGTGPSSGR